MQNEQRKPSQHLQIQERIRQDSNKQLQQDVSVSSTFSEPIDSYDSKSYINMHKYNKLKQLSESNSYRIFFKYRNTDVGLVLRIRSSCGDQQANGTPPPPNLLNGVFFQVLTSQIYTEVS